MTREKTNLEFPLTHAEIDAITIGQKCRGCGLKKAAGVSFCRRCNLKLSHEMWRGLNDRENYDANFRAALEYLRGLKKARRTAAHV